MHQALLALRDIADIKPGLSIKTAINNEPEGTHQVIMGKHLVPGKPYYYEPEHELRIILDRPVEKYLLERGDILFMSRGASNYPVVLKEFPQPAITPSTFYVIRAKQDILMPDYLAWVMLQEPFQAQLNDIRAGSGTLMVSRKGLEELTIVVPPFETQAQIVHLSELMQRELHIRQKLLNETERFQSAIGRKILDSISDSK